MNIPHEHCPECGARELPIGVDRKYVPRWEDDPLVIENGWNTPDRCPRCGAPKTFSRKGNRDGTR